MKSNFVEILFGTLFSGFFITCAFEVALILLNVQIASFFKFVVIALIFIYSFYKNIKTFNQ
jgi:hypothetical protein